MFMFSSACILSSSALLYFFLVPIVLRELVAIVVCSPENFESLASSITVERLPRLTVGFEFWSLIESPTGSSNLVLFVSGLTRRMCQIVLFRHDLAKKEQCSSVCTKITPVLLLTMYLVRIHAACLIVNRLASYFPVGEGSSKFLEKSLSVVWLTRDVILVLLFAVSSATASLVEAS